MKNILLSFLFCLGITTGFGQYTGNANDWIDYSAEYYKFKISEEGIYRIDKNLLQAAGMSSSDLVGNKFELFHNGEVVPIYVSTTGTFGNDDFIEFHGELNDGTSDKPLYENEKWQPSIHKSLFEDDGTYFLTATNNTASITNVESDLTNTPAKEEYFLYKSSVNYSDREKGKPYVISNTAIHSSDFTEFEGYAKRGVGNGINQNVSTEKIYSTNAESAVLEMTFAPQVYKPNYSIDVDYSASINNKKVFGITRKAMQRIDFTADYEVSDLNEGTTQVQFRENMSGYFVFADISITYPRTFDFDQKDTFEFNATDGSKYFELENIPKKDANVVFYERSTNSRYNLPHNDVLKIKTDASSKNHFFYDNEIESISAIEKVGQFENILQQADILLIYPEQFNQNISGENYIDKYIQHRASDIGGNQSVFKANIDEINNQFAYGIDSHSATIKNYLLELKENSKLPKHVVIFGKGVEYYQGTSQNSNLNIIPTFGQPGSDNLLVSDYYSIYQINTNIGRVSVKDLTELKNYINKIIDYETNIKDLSDAAQTKEKEWMKRGIHLGGGKGASEQAILKNYLNKYEKIFQDPFMGGEVNSFYKQSTDPIQTTESVLLDQLINEGATMLTFFGHSSPTTTEFNLRDPSEYTNNGKYFFMLNNGCFIGNIFSDVNSLSEQYITIENKGAIGFLGPSLYGISIGMNKFTTTFYNELSLNNYIEGAIGSHIEKAINNYKSNSSIAILTKQQMTYNGDPSIFLNYTPKQDYLITEEDISFSPDLITSDSETFEVIVDLTNIGKAVNEDVVIRLTRTLPNGDVEEYDETVSNIYFKKQVVFTIETNAIISEGLNTFNVAIDPDDLLDEVTRANNSLLSPIQRQVSSSNVSPVIPYEFAITNNRDLTLFASTINTEAVNKNFIIEIDTTENFNSPLLKSTTISAYGGTLSWKPNVNYKNTQEYYWRAKLNEQDQIWDVSSFIFLDDYTHGWNQSEYYQFQDNETENIEMQLSEAKEFKFLGRNRNLAILSGIYPHTNYADMGYRLDGYNSSIYRLAGNIAVAVFNGDSGVAWENEEIAPNQGKYGSVIRAGRVEPVFWYDLNLASQRDYFANLLENVISENEYVAIYVTKDLNKSTWTDTHVQDALISKGASMFNQVGDSNPYIYYYQNNNLNFDQSYEEVGANENVNLVKNVLMPVKFSHGTMTSPKIGPASSWDEFQWNWTSSYDNNPAGDVANYSIYGYTPDGAKQELFTDRTDASLDISSIDATQYPFVQLKYYAEDGENQTPPQLDYWRIIYEEVGELAIDVNDTVESLPIEIDRGQDTKLNFSIENIGTIDYDKVPVRYIFTDGNGGVQVVDKTYEAIPAGESIEISFDLEVEGINNVGLNSVLVDVNPNGLAETQAEQYHFNNVAFFNYSVKKDILNPYLDVTFDGIHIIDKDLVSDTPNILISLTDENPYFELDNPDDFEIVVTDLNGNETVYTVADSEITFFPGTEGNNTAKIEFNPQFVPGLYTLEVRARDRSDNLAAENKYRVEFEVTDEDIITRVVNYPNPFTTKTSFIANIIGEIPDQILIQIFAPNGQVVKEIQAIPSQVTVAQGSNYYQLADWDGNDNFGDPVGNGTYFYKVTMKRNGKTIEPKESEGMQKYFENGIGKLYILR